MPYTARYHGALAGGLLVFKRGFGLFAALLFSGPVAAKQAVDRPTESLDLATRLSRAQSIFENLDRPLDYGGVTRDKDDPNKLAWYNFRNFSNFHNFHNFHNFQNFHNFHNFQNFHNATIHQGAPLYHRPVIERAPVVERPMPRGPVFSEPSHGAVTLPRSGGSNVRPNQPSPAAPVVGPATGQPSHGSIPVFGGEATQPLEPAHTVPAAPTFGSGQNNPFAPPVHATRSVPVFGGNAATQKPAEPFNNHAANPFAPSRGLETSNKSNTSSDTKASGNQPNSNNAQTSNHVDADRNAAVAPPNSGSSTGSAAANAPPGIQNGSVLSNPNGGSGTLTSNGDGTWTLTGTDGSTGTVTFVQVSGQWYGTLTTQYGTGYLQINPNGSTIPIAAIPAANATATFTPNPAGGSAIWTGPCEYCPGGRFMPNVPLPPPPVAPMAPIPSAAAPSRTPAGGSGSSAAINNAATNNNAAAASNLVNQIANLLDSDPPPTPLRAQQLLDAYNSLDPSQQTLTSDQLKQLQQIAGSICSPNPCTNPSGGAGGTNGGGSGSAGSGGGASANAGGGADNGGSPASGTPSPHDPTLPNPQQVQQSQQRPADLHGPGSDIFESDHNRFMQHYNSGDLKQ